MRHRGRGVDRNTPVRFSELAVEVDPAEVSEEDVKQRTRFLDDTSRSVISTNTSPDLGFDASLNPYRGCEHGCSYCLAGETLILMADGKSKRLDEVKVGDEIIGTQRIGAYRRLVPTKVLDHWSTVKPAYRVTLADGTVLIASGDHRFLTERGWKHVTGSQQGAARRPHLTTANKLMGWGDYGSAPEPDADYVRGYLTGMIRGDAHLAFYSYTRSGRSHGNQYQFRLALKDMQALARSEAFLESLGVSTRRFVFSPASETRSEMHGIRSHKQSDFTRIQEIVAWPSVPDRSWRLGLLAGAFDAEGSAHEGLVRYSNTNSRYLEEVRFGLLELGLKSVSEAPRAGVNRPVQSLRLLGGMTAYLRLMTATDPAITRKREVTGRAIKSSSKLQVTSIDPHAAACRLYDITTGTGDFIANGVVSHNCYARPTHEYLGLSAGLDFERVIMVKRRAAELLESELRKKSWQPKVLMLSGVTDPYQPVERRLEVTRECLKVLARFKNPVSIITKNALVTRDADLLSEMASWNGARVTLSITTLDETLRAGLEPRTSTIANRLGAIRELAAAGVPVGVNVAPVIPGLTDHEMPGILEAAAAAGASHAGFTVVRLPGAVSELFTDWLDEHAPLRKQRVLNRIGEAHLGDLDDKRFGLRMSGSGGHAQQIGALFRLTRKRLGMGKRGEPLNTAEFAVPGRMRQGTLF